MLRLTVMRVRRCAVDRPTFTLTHVSTSIWLRMPISGVRSSCDTIEMRALQPIEFRFARHVATDDHHAKRLSLGMQLHRCEAQPACAGPSTAP